MKKYIVPVDFSEHSEYALKAAAKMAKDDESEILALHMLESSDSHFSVSDSQHLQELYFYLQLAENRFNEFLKKPYLKGVNVIPLVKHFKVFQEVNDIAESHCAEMIIMGSHGVSGAKEFLLGSNTEKVIRHAEIPVLVVKNELEESNFNKIVFATNFELAAIEAYNMTKSFAKLWNSELLILYINLPNERFLSSEEIHRKSEIFLKSCGETDHIKANIHVECVYTVEKGVLSFADKMNADLLVIPTHGRRGLANFFVGSIGEDIANHATLQVMTIKLK